MSLVVLAFAAPAASAGPGAPTRQPTVGSSSSRRRPSCRPSTGLRLGLRRDRRRLRRRDHPAHRLGRHDVPPPPRPQSGSEADPAAWTVGRTCGPAARTAREDGGGPLAAAPRRYLGGVRCPVHDGFDPLSAEFLADPYAVLASLPAERRSSSRRRSTTTSSPATPTSRRSSSTRRRTRRPPRSCRSFPLVPEALTILAEGGHRPQPSMVSLDPPPTRVFAARRRARSRHGASRRWRTGSARRSTSCSTRSTPARRSTSSRRSPSRCPRRSCSRSWASRSRTGPLKAWCGSRATLAWGRPRPDEQVEHARNMAAYRGYLRDLVASKVDDARRRLRERAARDPRRGSRGAQLRGDRLDPVLALLRGSRDDELPDRQPDPAAARGALALGGGRGGPAADPRRGRETLRFDPSVPVWRRITTRPVTLGGVELPEGAKLFLWLASTGRDAAVFPEPDRFDPRRENAHQRSRSARASTIAPARASASSRRGSRSRA